MKTIKLFAVMMFALLFMVSCTDEQNEIGKPDEVLISYLPEVPYQVEGDGDYYHEVQKIETLETEKDVTVIMQGEVKALTSAKHLKDHQFEVKLKVTGEDMTQFAVGDKLNDSEFEPLILLRAPVSLGNKWSFWTKDRQGKHIKVGAEITSYDEESGNLTVRYTTKGDYYEERQFRKGMGVTDFTRLVTFKNESTITGYHLIETGDGVNVTEDNLPDRVLIPSRYYALILGFNQAWSRYLNGKDTDVFDFVVSESEASKKMTALSTEDFKAVVFVSFYPYQITRAEEGAIVHVVEQYEADSGEVLINKVKYQILEVDGIPKIIDFSSEK